MHTRGIRGAITVAEDTPNAIKEATIQLFSKIIETNEIKTEDISYVLFTLTKDLQSAFPAKFARENFDIKYVPLMNVNELDVEGSLEKCLRILMVVNTTKAQNEIKHIYLGGASVLRSDLLEK